MAEPMGKLKSKLLLFALAFGEEGRAGGAAPPAPPPRRRQLPYRWEAAGTSPCPARGSPRSPKLGDSGGFRRCSFAGRNTPNLWQSACKTRRTSFAAQRVRRNRACLGLTVTKKKKKINPEIENHRRFQTLILPAWHNPPTPLHPRPPAPPGTPLPRGWEVQGIIRV